MDWFAITFAKNERKRLSEFPQVINNTMTKEETEYFEWIEAENKQVIMEDAWKNLKILKDCKENKNQLIHFYEPIKTFLAPEYKKKLQNLKKEMEKLDSEIQKAQNKYNRTLNEWLEQREIYKASELPETKKVFGNGMILHGGGIKK